MDAFLDCLEHFALKGTLERKALVAVLKKVDNAKWNDERIKLLVKVLPEQVPIKPLAEWLFSSGSSIPFGSGMDSVDQILGEPLNDPVMAAASAVRQAPIILKPDNNDWKELLGTVFEPTLQVDNELGDSPVRLLDARFIIELEKRGGRLRRRQELPDDVFISLDTLMRLPNPMLDRKYLPILSVSHTWHQPDHPDNEGFNLKILASFLDKLLKGIPGVCTTFAVFLDFGSLFQKGSVGEPRSPEAQKLFDISLSNMMDWYAHPHNFVCKLTRMPEGYPEGFNFQASTPNTASYINRGWCYCESSVSGLVKGNYQVWDLGNWTGSDINHELEKAIRGRIPPVTPDDFREIIATKSFTSKKVDQAIVIKLYETIFWQQLPALKAVCLAGLNWGNAEVASFCKVIACGALQNCMQLKLSTNKIGDEGMRCFAEALGKGALQSCEKLHLYCNQVGDEGMRCFAEALGKGALQSCKELNISGKYGHYQFGDEGMCCLAEALDKGALQSCEKLDLSGNQFGDEGMRCFAEALGKGALQSCEKLNLSGNQFGDEGMRCFVEALGKGALQSCEKLNLSGTRQFGDEGMRCLAEALGKGALQSCEKLDLSGNQSGDEGMRCFVEALGKGALQSCEQLFFARSGNKFDDEGMRCLAEARANAEL